MSKVEIFSAECFSQLPEVTEIVIEVEAALNRRSLPEAVVSDLCLVLAEALNNVVEHAYSGREDGRIIVRVFDDGATVSALLSDEGAPFIFPQSPQMSGPTEALEDLPEGGFGCSIIHELSDHVEFSRTDGQNLLLVEFSQHTKSCSGPDKV